MVLVRLKKGRGKGVETGAPAGAQKKACFTARVLAATPKLVAASSGGARRRGFNCGTAPMATAKGCADGQKG